MAKTTIRLKDIADRTGFSTNTVSLALRQSPRIPVQTREVIQAAASELNYLPNHVAQSLVSRATKTIGLVLTDITNPTLTHTAQAIELRLAARGYGTLFATSNDNLEEEIRVLELFRGRRVDGMLIYPTSHRRLDHIRPLRNDNYPIVLLAADAEAGLDAVCIDDRLGAWKATRHLIELGHRAVGIINDANSLGNFEKQEGYQRALAESGIAVDPAFSIIPRGGSADAGYAAMGEMMTASRRPTAVFTANDSLAIGAVSWCRQNGLALPEDVAVVGFDNVEFAPFAAVPLTSVNYAVQHLTDMAVDRLMRLIAAGDHLPAPQVTMIEPELVVRSSTVAAHPLG